MALCSPPCREQQAGVRLDQAVVCCGRAGWHGQQQV